MKRGIGILLAALMLFASLPSGANGSGSRGISSGTIIDTDGSDGYSGDYVVIFNPSTMVDNVKTTGDMSGLIESEVEPYAKKERDDTHVRLPMRDIDAELAREAAAKGETPPLLFMKKYLRNAVAQEKYTLSGGMCQRPARYSR